MRNWTEATPEQIQEDILQMTKALYDYDPLQRRWPRRVPEHLMRSTSTYAYVRPLAREDGALRRPR